MIRLEHINIVGTDIERSLKFYQAAFPDWKVRAEGVGEWYGKPRRWVHFGDDYQYLAINDFGEGANRDTRGHATGFAHMGFTVNNLDAIIHRLQSAGFSVAFDGAAAEYRKNVYFMDPDGFEVEFIEYLSDIVSQRNQ